MAVKKRKKAVVKSKVKTRVKTRAKAKTTTTGSKNLAAEKKRIAKKSGSYVTSKEDRPISKRTYELETKRKGTTKGYRKSKGKYYKSETVVK